MGLKTGLDDEAPAKSVSARAAYGAVSITFGKCFPVLVERGIDAHYELSSATGIGSLESFLKYDNRSQ